MGFGAWARNILGHLHMLSSGAVAKRIVGHPRVASAQVRPCPTGNYLPLSDTYIRASTVCCEIRIIRECWCGRCIRESWCGGFHRESWCGGFPRESWCAGLVNRFQRLGAVQARGVAVRLLTTRVNEKEGNETERR